MRASSDSLQKYGLPAVWKRKKSWKFAEMWPQNGLWVIARFSQFVQQQCWTKGLQCKKNGEEDRNWGRALLSIQKTSSECQGIEKDGQKVTMLEFLAHILPCNSPRIWNPARTLNTAWYSWAPVYFGQVGLNFESSSSSSEWRSFGADFGGKGQPSLNC